MKLVRCKLIRVRSLFICNHWYFCIEISCLDILMYHIWSISIIFFLPFWLIPIFLFSFYSAVQMVPIRLPEPLCILSHLRPAVEADLGTPTFAHPLTSRWVWLMRSHRQPEKKGEGRQHICSLVSFLRLPPTILTWLPWTDCFFTKGHAPGALLNISWDIIHIP